MIVSVAVRAPKAAGVKVTVIVQVPLFATGALVLQVPPGEKSPLSAPVKAMLEIMSELPLLFVRVTVCGVLPTPTV